MWRNRSRRDIQEDDGILLSRYADSSGENLLVWGWTQARIQMPIVGSSVDRHHCQRHLQRMFNRGGRQFQQNSCIGRFWNPLGGNSLFKALFFVGGSQNWSALSLKDEPIYKEIEEFGWEIYENVMIFWQRARISFITLALYAWLVLVLNGQSIKHRFRGNHIIVSSPAELTIRLRFLVLGLAVGNLLSFTLRCCGWQDGQLVWSNICLIDFDLAETSLSLLLGMLLCTALERRRELTFSITNVATLPTPSYKTPFAFSTPANLTPGTYSPWLLAASEAWNIQSRKMTIRALIPVSHAEPERAGCNTAPVSALILVVVWFVNRTAIFFVAASLAILEIRSPITAQRLPDAHWAASLFLAAGFCWPLALSPAVLGKAKANRVDMESTTIRVVSAGGKEEDGWIRRASRWGNVGVVKWWKFWRYESIDAGSDVASSSGIFKPDKMSLNLEPTIS